jgi:AraC-like DNA-binding protein
VVTLDQGGFARASTWIAAPPPDLADIVEHAFVRRDGALPRPAGPWRIVPDPSANLVVVVRNGPGGRTVGAAVVGARSTYADTDVRDRELTLGLRLRPGALAALAHERAAAFTNRGVAADAVFGAAWRGVADRIGEGDVRAAAAALFALVRARARTGRTDPARALIDAARQADSVDAMARALAMPVRTLHKRTREAIGLAPKRLLRIVRIHRVLESHRRGRGWAALAIRAGFADQSHLVREAQALLGEAPRAWIARGAPGADPFKTPAGSPASVWT